MKCKACACPIEFIEGPNAVPIPVQKVRTVYYRNGDKPLAKVTTLLPEAPLYVSHFETCSNPGRFSGGKS